MKNKVITSQGNVQFIFPDGKIVNVHPNHIYTAFNEDTVSFILVALPKSSGLALMTSKAEDLELNGETYSFAELPAAMSEAFAIAGAQARCEIVDELPETGYTNTIYLVPQPSPQTGFDEYVYVDGEWELIGDTSIEMENYVTKTVFSGYTASTAAELSGKAEVVEITQANYDLLPSSAKTDASKLYVISDAQPIDLSVYAKTSAVTSADTALDSKIDAVSGATDAALTLKQNLLTAGTGIDITSDVISVTGSTGGITSGEVQTMIDESISGKTDESAFTAHTADSVAHITAAERTAWNAKSDFSGSYNDLTNKLSAGTNVTIVDNVISAEGGGKAIEAGRGITVTTGATADTVSFNLPISAGTGENSIIIGDERNISSGRNSVAEGFLTSATTSYAHAEGSRTLVSGGFSSHAEGSRTSATSDASHSEGYQTSASGEYSHSEGRETSASGQGSHTEGRRTSATTDGAHSEGSATLASGQYSHSEGYQTSASGQYSHSEGWGTTANGKFSHSEGSGTTASGEGSHTEGKGTIALNKYEHSEGYFNVSSSGSSTFGNSGNTLFSIGNGTAENARHNAFEIRQNGDIYLTKDGQDVKLQDQLGGGSIEVSSAVTSGDTNPVAGGALYDELRIVETSVTSTEITMLQDGSGYHAFNIPSNCYNLEIIGVEGVVETLYINNKEVYYQFSNNSWTILNIDSSLSYAIDDNKLYITSDSVIDQITSYDSISSDIYGLGYGGTITPLIDKVKENEEVTSAALTDLNDKFGGLKLVKISQSDYDNLQNKDDSTLYVIVN